MRDNGFRLHGPGRAALLVAIFALLFASYGWNIFRIGTQQRAANIAVDTTYMVPAMSMFAQGPPLQRLLGEMQIQEGLGTHPYLMQVGVHRMVFSLLSPDSEPGVDRAVPYLRKAIEASLALLFTAFVAIMLDEFGPTCAVITGVLLALSNWLVIFAPDLFWTPFTFFLPFLLGWWLGDPARPRKQHHLLAVLFTLACLLKCLCGYDYLTNIFGAVAVPFLYFGLSRGYSLRSVIWRTVRYGALSVGAFAIAVGMQLLQFTFVGQGLHASLSYFIGEAGRRTSSNGEGISNHYDQAVLNTLHKLHLSSAHDPAIGRLLVPMRAVLRYFHYLAMGGMTIPFPFHSLTLPIGMFVLAVVALAWAKRKSLRAALASGSTDRFTALLCSTFLAMIISHFWAVAANGHMTHTFFNAIIFYIPFLPMMYALIGVAVSPWMERNFRLPAFLMR